MDELLMQKINTAAEEILPDAKCSHHPGRDHEDLP